MAEAKVKSRLQVSLFGLTICLGGICFGQSISLFNTFFDIFMRGCYPSTPPSQYITIKSNLNVFYSLGFILCMAVSGYLFQYLGRKKFLIIVCTMNVIICGLEPYPNLYLLYVLRFLSGEHLL